MIADQDQTALKRTSQDEGSGTFSASNRSSRLRPMWAVLLIALTYASTACSNKALYENIQQNQQRACEDLPIPQQTQCKALYDTSYEEYRRELEEIGEN